MDKQKITAELTFYDKDGNTLLTVARGEGLHTLLKVPDGAIALRHVFWVKEDVTMMTQGGDT